MLLCWRRSRLQQEKNAGEQSLREQKWRKLRWISPLRLSDWLLLLGLNTDEAPRFRSLTLPTVKPSYQRLLRSVSRKVPRGMGQMSFRLGGLAQLYRPLRPLLRRLPIGGIVVLSAVKESEGRTIIGRPMRVVGEKNIPALMPSARTTPEYSKSTTHG